MSNPFAGAAAIAPAETARVLMNLRRSRISFSTIYTDIVLRDEFDALSANQQIHFLRDLGNRNRGQLRFV